MTDTAPAKRPVLSMAFAVVSVAAILIAFAVSKKTGLVEDATAKRGAAAMLGILLVVVGNYVPKLHLFQTGASASSSGPLDRFAGWIFVLAGLAFAGIWIFAPVDKATLGSPLIGIAAFLLVLARWLMWTGKRRAGIVPVVTPGRMLAGFLLVTILWCSLIFLADRFWGDAAAQWMAVGFIIALPLLLVPAAIALRYQRKA